MWGLRETQDPQDLGTDLKWDLEEAEDVGKVTRFLVRAAAGEATESWDGRHGGSSRGHVCAPWSSPAGPVLGMKYQSPALGLNACGRG